MSATPIVHPTWATFLKVSVTEGGDLSGATERCTTGSGRRVARRGVVFGRAKGTFHTWGSGTATPLKASECCHRRGLGMRASSSHLSNQAMAPCGSTTARPTQEPSDKTYPTGRATTTGPMGTITTDSSSMASGTDRECCDCQEEASTGGSSRTTSGVVVGSSSTRRGCITRECSKTT